MLKKLSLAIVMAILCLTAPALHAQQPAQTAPLPAPEPFKRTVLQKQDFPAGYTSYVVLVQIAPHYTVPRHSHPGIEMGYMTAGSADLMVDGRPVQHMKVGDSYSIPAGVAHSAVAGRKVTKLVSTFVVEAGKPLASPAP
jgi:quercetin dioxygenase-like cupin family protein